MGAWTKFFSLNRTVVIALTLTAFFHNTPLVLAAACCGSSSVVPSLITSDDRFQISGRTSYAGVVGDVNPSGTAIFRANDDNESIQVLQLDGAALVSDSWQVGAKVPVVRQQRASGDVSEQATGFGDTALSVGYEFLPEGLYSPIRPRGFLFSQLTFPTGPSIYESTSSFAMDARSRGFFAAGFGTVLTKNLEPWDFSFVAEAHQPFARSFTNSLTGGSLHASPRWGGSLSLAAGHTPKLLGRNVRFGAAVTPQYEGPIRTQTGNANVGVNTNMSSSQLVWNTSFQASYFPNMDWTLMLSYNDQTLLGPAHNTILTRSVAFFVQKRWPR